MNKYSSAGMEQWKAYTTSSLGHTLSLLHPPHWTSCCDQVNGKILFEDPEGVGSPPSRYDTASDPCPIPGCTIVKQPAAQVSLREYTVTAVQQLKYLYHLTSCCEYPLLPLANCLLAHVGACKLAGKKARRIEYCFTHPSLRKVPEAGLSK